MSDMGTEPHLERDEHLRSEVTRSCIWGLTVFDVVYLINESLVCELSGERRDQVHSTVEENETVNTWCCLLHAGIDL